MIKRACGEGDQNLGCVLYSAPEIDAPRNDPTTPSTSSSCAFIYYTICARTSSLRLSHIPWLRSAFLSGASSQCPTIFSSHI
ncbi:hypothetical protein CBOM_07545 [Ceraceosorus bombacis]|uniref:Uncharacterized protein n=1 Tax=Ceraceosorus bombacis TaxID=401625 RepID=A0A0N7L8Y3_9BASI|nr:hypothetical protein CBOM_07545 [Ceraceosorus bombacis]